MCGRNILNIPLIKIGTCAYYDDVRRTYVYKLCDTHVIKCFAYRDFELMYVRMYVCVRNYLKFVLYRETG